MRRLLLALIMLATWPCIASAAAFCGTSRDELLYVFGAETPDKGKTIYRSSYYIARNGDTVWAALVDSESVGSPSAPTSGVVQRLEADSTLQRRLQETLNRVRIGTLADCRRFAPELPDFAIDETITWLGRNRRRNSFRVSTAGAAPPCSPAVYDLLSELTFYLLHSRPVDAVGPR